MFEEKHEITAKKSDYLKSVQRLKRKLIKLILLPFKKFIRFILKYNNERSSNIINLIVKIFFFLTIPATACWRTCKTSIV